MSHDLGKLPNLSAPRFYSLYSKDSDLLKVAGRNGWVTSVKLVLQLFQDAQRGRVKPLSVYNSVSCL